MALYEIFRAGCRDDPSAATHTGISFELTRHSDEPEEVEVVEQQLTEHLDMDPRVTLAVLCDQIFPIAGLAASNLFHLLIYLTTRFPVDTFLLCSLALATCQT